MREALIRIEREGLIEVIPQSGTYITKIDMKAAEEGRFIRECIEPKIMTEAALRIDDGTMELLRQNLDEQDQTANNQEPDAFFDLDQTFHHSFYNVVGRDSVWQWLQINNTQLNRFRRLRLKQLTLDWDMLATQHKQIYTAIQSKNVDDLLYLVGQHLHLMLDEKQQVLDAYSDYFQNIGEKN